MDQDILTTAPAPRRNVADNFGRILNTRGAAPTRAFPAPRCDVADNAAGRVARSTNARPSNVFSSR